MNDADDADRPATTPSSDGGGSVPVVGIGASAGGLGAFEALLPAIKPDSGLAYVVVTHLDPDRESILTDLLSRLATIPVVSIDDGVAVEPDHIYVLPPNASLTVADGRLHLARPLELRGHRMPIDGFFMSLAEARGDNAAGIVLSGAGSDGTLGLRAIKEHGGLTIAQEGAEHDGMMRSAVRSGMVDFVLPLTEIPPKLDGYFRHLAGRSQRNGDGVHQATDQLMRICALLRARTGNDFSGYKDKTVARRVQRRMQVLQIDEVPDFIERLRRDGSELDALLQDLLIGVTNFFRDPAAFEALEKQVIPGLFEGKGPDDTVRVWVTGCSTGEEAYSLAILLREHAERTHAHAKLQVFASDIDEEALQIARTGRYPATIAKDVSPERLERFFTREDGTYRISNELREICLFSVHNLLRDAPFSKLDLLSCRNLLIYLTPELQNRLIPLFHYALNDGGVLFLGSSENVSRHARLFATVDKAHRLFRRRRQTERRLPEFPLTAPQSSDHPPTGARRDTARQSLQAIAEHQLIERYAPAYVVVAADGEVLHGSARTGKYLEMAAGTPRMDVFSMTRQGLRPDLRAGLHRAVTTGQIVVQKNVVVGTNGGRQTIDLVIHPLRPAPSGDQLYMLVFQDVGGIRSTEEPGDAGTADEVENANIRQLEADLRTTKERLQSTTEELESSNEELKSGNEELSSMNEELQSANEELETSKEELQSINEELQTVNAELNARVEELSRANSDIANLLESTQIATLFLDRNLAVKSFTPAAKDVFRLVESDTGRPISHVRARFRADTLQEDTERVLRTLATIERTVECDDRDARYVMRILPYRTIDNVIGGVVITFIDITRITAAETRIGELTADLRERIQSLETLLDVVPVGIAFLRDPQGSAVVINRHGRRLIGEARPEADGRAPRPISEALRLFRDDQELPPDQHPLRRAIDLGATPPAFEGQLQRLDGRRIDVMVLSTPLLEESGEIRGAIAAVVDISERKVNEARRLVLLHELQHRVKNIIATISALATRTLRGSPAIQDASDAFLGRLRGMASTHELLSRANWSGASLAALVETALRPYQAPDAANVTIRGPEVMLPPSAAATLGMVFYELATNAAKYGGLSESTGGVEVAWQIVAAANGQAVALTWSETGGKPVRSPMVEGFGTTFVKRSIEYELQGSAELELLPLGIRWKLMFTFETPPLPPE